MNRETRLKGLGYLSSIVSVLLLGAVAWSSASEKPLLLAALVLGIATSIGGMGLRWRSMLVQQRRQE